MQPGWTPPSFRPTERRTPRFLRYEVVLLCLPVLILIRCLSALAGPRPVSTPSTAQIGAIVTEFLSQLGMSVEVTVTTAPVNDKMVSVERIPGAGSQTAAFRLCFDEQFLANLDPDEL